MQANWRELVHVFLGGWFAALCCGLCVDGHLAGAGLCAVFAGVNLGVAVRP